MASEFAAAFEELFEREFPRLFRYLDRLSGDPDLAADLTQEAFIRLHRRGAMPERPDLWLVTVALNRFRSARSTDSRRTRLLQLWRAREPEPDQATAAGSLDRDEPSRRVSSAMSRLSARDRELLLLRADGYSYRDIAATLDLNEASIGTLLARARQAFRRAYGSPDASH